MPESSRDVAPAPAGPGPGWMRSALVGLLGLHVVASGLHQFLDDDRLRSHTALLWPMTAALIIAVASRRGASVAGPSPWTPALLRAVAVIAGLAGGILRLAAGLSSSPEDDPSAAALALTLLALLAVLVVVVLAVLVRAASRGLSWRARSLPGLSRDDRRRARDIAAAPVALYCVAVLLGPWLPSSLLIWVPVAVAFAAGAALWAWWVTRLAATRH
jgi:hypothetical protein